MRYLSLTYVRYGHQYLPGCRIYQSTKYPGIGAISNTLPEINVYVLRSAYYDVICARKKKNQNLKLVLRSRHAVSPPHTEDTRHLRHT